MNRCITCNKPLNVNKAHMKVEYRGETYLVCCPLCQSEFERDPDAYVQRRASKRRR